jgi:hypothetical protein
MTISLRVLDLLVIYNMPKTLKEVVTKFEVI